jgi:hypothetical protein
MRKRRAQRPSASNGAREQPAAGAAAKAIDHVFSAQIASAGRQAEISSDYANWSDDELRQMVRRHTIDHGGKSCV